MRSGETLLGCYLLLRLLGEGGSSKVYLARNTKVGQLVAVKIVRKQGGENSWLAEKELLIELRHPSIPVIIDIAEDEGHYYLVEEYIEGMLLSDYKGKLQEGEALDIMRQLCDVLSYLHTSLPTPIIYKDLKPNNIIMMKNGHLKLIDFGIAVKHDGSSRIETGRYGTDGFAAPELYGIGDVDARTDIYSLGVMMYYLMTGISLVKQPSANPDGQKLSRALDVLLKKMAASLPDRRPESMLDVAEEIEALIEGKRKSDLMETLMERVPHVVVVLGLGSRMGTTHTAIQIASAIRVAGSRPLLVEAVAEGGLSDLCCTDYVEQMNRQSLEAFGITIYPYQKKMPVQALLDEKPDVLVVDGGEMKHWRLSNGPNTTVVAVSTVQDWETSRVEAYLMNHPPANVCYGLNLASQERFDRFAKALPDLEFMRIPYANQPFEPHECIVQWVLGRLTDGKEAAGNGARNRGFNFRHFVASLVASK